MEGSDRVGNFSCIARDVDSILHVAFSGELDIATVDDARASLVDPLACAQQTVVLDLRDVTFIDSLGLKFIVDMRRAVERSRGRLYITQPSPPTKRLLELADMADRIEEIDDPLGTARPCPVCDVPVSAVARRCTTCNAVL